MATGNSLASEIGDVIGRHPLIQFAIFCLVAAAVHAFVQGTVIMIIETLKISKICKITQRLKFLKGEDNAESGGKLWHYFYWTRDFIFEKYPSTRNPTSVLFFWHHIYTDGIAWLRSGALAHLSIRERSGRLQAHAQQGMQTL
jgi:hypothetical protein